MTITSLFSGAGGLDLGFIQAGHFILWANDVYDDAVATYKKNIGNHIVKEDIHNISSYDIPDCDLIIGGFPCQGFSVANVKRHTHDARNSLYKELLRVIKDNGEVFLSEKARWSYDATIPPRIILPEYVDRENLRWRWDNYNGA